ncbi:DUF3397 domain-containing protein [Enterococcus sp. JM9B]|uniref:DUF3397 domain-containing protein n=1 Tax=Enterococcus sp. JM9B TaxID=1857216 RepID=UPI001374B892|nr:DUF3397 domain-containing protein [Enterococcus sp. JM9B]KAF1301341.1 hypothetical protein BAU16_10120 [Enterococcus sp. JM9B]
MQGFTPVLVFWYLFPIIVLFAANFLVTTFSLQKRLKIKAPDISVPFLWLGLHQLSQNTFETSFLPYFFISILFTGIIVAVFQAYYYGEILYARYGKMFWRLVFLLSIIVYVVLIVLNLLHYL